jgi:hypothetical protein
MANGCGALMKRLLITGLMLFSTIDMALAESVSDRIFANLRAQGYFVVQQDRTWLGRIWVLARNKTVQREVVFDPTTGEVLRDYTVLLADLESQMQIDLARDNGDGDHPVPTLPLAVATSEAGEAVVVVRELPEPFALAEPLVTIIEPEKILTDEVKAMIGLSP